MNCPRRPCRDNEAAGTPLPRVCRVSFVVVCFQGDAKWVISIEKNAMFGFLRFMGF
jgi:hypothetical protein